MSTMTSTKPATATKATATKAAPKASTKPATKASAAKEAAATELRRNAARNADRMPDLGDYKEGDKVATADGREWTVVGPAQGNTTLKLTREHDGKKESVFRFARNIKRVGK